MQLTLSAASFQRLDQQLSEKLFLHQHHQRRNWIRISFFCIFHLLTFTFFRFSFFLFLYALDHHSGNGKLIFRFICSTPTFPTFPSDFEIESKTSFQFAPLHFFTLSTDTYPSKRTPVQKMLLVASPVEIELNRSELCL